MGPQRPKHLSACSPDKVLVQMPCHHQRALGSMLIFTLLFPRESMKHDLASQTQRGFFRFVITPFHMCLIRPTNAASTPGPSPCLQRGVVSAADRGRQKPVDALRGTWLMEPGPDQHSGQSRQAETRRECTRWEWALSCSTPGAGLAWESHSLGSKSLRHCRPARRPSAPACLKGTT